MAKLSDADRHTAMLMYATTGNAGNVAKTYGVSSSVIYKSWERLPESKKKELKDQNTSIIEDAISVAEESYITNNADKLCDFYTKLTETKIAIVEKIQSQINAVDDTEFDIPTLNTLVNALAQISSVGGGDQTSVNSSDDDFFKDIIKGSVINIQNNYGEK